jgi:hypothetical protein
MMFLWLICFMSCCMGIDAIISHGTLFHSDTPVRGIFMQGPDARKV